MLTLDLSLVSCCSTENIITIEGHASPTSAGIINTHALMCQNPPPQPPTSFRPMHR